MVPVPWGLRGTERAWRTGRGRGILKPKTARERRRKRERKRENKREGEGKELERDE